MLALVLALLSLAGPAPRGAQPEAWRQGVDAALERAGEGGELAVLEASRSLRQLGPRALPTLLVALGEERGSTTSARARALLVALDAADLEDVRAAAERAGASPLGLIGASVALGQLGSAADAHALARLATAAAQRSELDPLAARALEQALAHLCERDAHAATACGDLLAQAHPRVRERIVLALGARASDRRIEALSRALGLDPSLDRLALAELGRLGLAQGRKASTRALERIRPLLAAPDPRVAGDAALALGRLGDGEAVGELVALLRRPEVELAEKAHRALVVLTGLRLREDPARWEGWYRGEERWWREHALRWLERLGPAALDAGSSGASEAILELARRRLHREEAAAAVLHVLGDEDDALVALACAALAELGCASALPALVDCLEHPAEDVREAARSALRRLTGRDLPPETEAWRAILPG